MISCTECMISYIANMISYPTSEHTCRSGPKSGRAGSWPLGRASALLLSQCCPLSNAARYCPLSAVTSVPIMIADSCPPVRRCCPRFRMQNRVGIRLLIDCIRESRSAGTILWHYAGGRARTRRQWLVVIVRRPPRGWPEGGQSSLRPFWRCPVPFSELALQEGHVFRFLDRVELVEPSTRTRRLRPPRRSLRHEGRRCRDGRGSQPPGPPGRQRKSWRCTVLVNLEAAWKERAAGTMADFCHGRQGAL